MKIRLVLTQIDATISNEFATGAYRFGHTLVNGFLRRYNSRHELLDELSLADLIFRPVEAYNTQMGGLDSFIFGLLLTPAGKYDSMFSNVLRNHLFEAKNMTQPGWSNQIGSNHSFSFFSYYS